MRTEFMINTPYHKRWMLPDGEHYYNSVIHGEFLYESVWNARSDKLVISCPAVKLDVGGRWKELAELAQSLAEKKFRKRTVAERYR